jgi:hypothetical protein
MKPSSSTLLLSIQSPKPGAQLMREKKEEYRVDVLCLQITAILKRVLHDKDTTPAKEAEDTSND